MKCFSGRLVGWIESEAVLVAKLLDDLGKRIFQFAVFAGKKPAAGRGGKFLQKCRGFGVFILNAFGPTWVLRPLLGRRKSPASAATAAASPSAGKSAAKNAAVASNGRKSYLRWPVAGLEHDRVNKRVALFERVEQLAA